MSEKGNGFTEFKTERGEVERLLAPFRALGDMLQDTLDQNDDPAGYSRFDLFGYHPKQHEGFEEALWEAWRMWQLDGYPPAKKAVRSDRYKPGVKNIADAVGRGTETWDRDSKGTATVEFDHTLKSYFENLGFGVPRIDKGFLDADAYTQAVTYLLEAVANGAFPRKQRTKTSGAPAKNAPPTPAAEPTPAEPATAVQPKRSVRTAPPARTAHTVESRFWPQRFWHHLFYAFAIEATNALAIYKKLIETSQRGEDVGFFSQDSQRWMRSTECVVRRNGGGSDFGGDPGARARRNAYYRMFGLDLDKVLSTGVAYDKADAANLDFVRIFEDLLYEVWRAYTNKKNESGPNQTDPVAILEICRSLRDMLNDRRLYGTLTRVEYAAVMEMSWHYLVIDGNGNDENSNSPIVFDMRCMATTPDERLRKLGDLVKVPAHPKTRSLLKLAERVSLLLIEIEADVYTDEDAVRLLYEGGDTTRDMLEIINEWSILVGRDVKAARTAAQREISGADPVALLGR